MAAPAQADPLNQLPQILPTDQRLSVLLKGGPGVGKTELAHSFPGPLFTVYTDPNRRTITDLMSKRLKIDARRITTWKQYSELIVPMVVNRRIVAETVIVDTVDFLLSQMWEDIRGTRSGLQIQDFGTGLRRASEGILALVSATMPTKDHPGYNIVCTVHTKDVTDNSGSLVKVSPSIMGQFKDDIEVYFDVVLICEKDMKTHVQVGQPAVKKRVFKLLSMPPDRYQTCKAPTNWPPVLEINEGESGYELIRDLWHPPVQQPQPQLETTK